MKEALEAKEEVTCMPKFNDAAVNVDCKDFKVGKAIDIFEEPILEICIALFSFIRSVQKGGGGVHWLPKWSSTRED